MIGLLARMIARILVGDLVDACDRAKVTADLKVLFDELEQEAA